jgi:hypothetical protein
MRRSVMLIIINCVVLLFLVMALLSMQGCSAPRTKAHRAVMEHQVEGQLVYREVDGVKLKYYVECEYGFKYLSSTASNERIGPVDTCEGEE